jgi:hypothetical protein
MICPGVTVDKNIIKKTRMNFHRYDWNTSFIKAWKVLGALVRPKGTTKNSKWSWWVRNAIFSMSVGYIPHPLIKLFRVCLILWCRMFFFKMFFNWKCIKTMLSSKIKNCENCFFQFHHPTLDLLVIKIHNLLWFIFYGVILVSLLDFNS